MARNYATVYLIALLVGLCISACKEVDNISLGERYDKLIDSVLNDIAGEWQNSVMIMSHQLCHTCIVGAISPLDSMNGKLNIVLLGEKTYEINDMDAIYRNINFIYADRNIYKQIKKDDPVWAVGLAIGVRVNSTGDTIVYIPKRGIIIQEQVLSVLEFIR